MTPRRAQDLDALDDVFLRCRTAGHSWEPRVTYRGKQGRRLVDEAVWYCEREARAGVDPPTEKSVLSAAAGADRGRLIGDPVYRWPDGYLVEAGVPRGRSRPLARATLMDRLAAASDRAGSGR